MRPSAGNLLNVFCMALKVDKDAYLPQYWFESLEQVPLFKDACLARYQAMGMWLRSKPNTAILEGIYTKVSGEGNKVVCNYDTRANAQKYQVEFEDFYDSVVIEDPWDLKTSVKLEKGSRTVIVSDMYTEFSGNDVVLPPIEIENDWLQFLHSTEDNKVKFALKEEFVVTEEAGEVAPPIHKRPVKKRRVSGSSDTMTANGEAEGSTISGLSAALNQRLRRLS